MTKTIGAINQWFKRAAAKVIALRWAIIIMAVALDIIALGGVRQIELQTTYESWFLKDDPLTIATEKFKDVFGNMHYVALLIETDNVFTPDTLRMIRQLGEDLLDNVPFAEDIVSLADFEFTLGSEEGLEILNIIPDPLSNDLGEIEKIRQLAFSKKFLVNRLFSDDSKEAWVLLRLERYPEEWGLDELPPYRQVAEGVEAILKQTPYNAYQIKTAGRPIMQHEQRVFFPREAGRIIVLAFVVAIIILAVILRSSRDVVVPLFSCVSALLWTFGMMGWFGIKIDSIAVTLPIYLGLALSIGYSIHLFNLFTRHFLLTGDRRASVIDMLEQTGWPILFTAITTLVAMLTFYVVPVEVVRWLGLASATTVFVVYVAVMLLTPALLSFGKDGQPHPHYIERGGGRLEHLFGRLSDWILSHPTQILVVFAIIVITCLIGLTQIYVSMDFTHSYGMRIPFVKRFNYISRTKVGAYQSYELTLRFDEQDRAKSPDVLKNFDLLASEVEEFEIVKRTTSLLEIIKDLNQVMHEDDPAFFRIPDEGDLVAQLLLLYEIASGTETERWVDYDYTTLRLMIEITDFDTSLIEQDFRYLEERTQELFPDAEANVVGNAVQISVAQNYIAKGEVVSFTMALIIIGILMMFVFRSITTGLIGMIPNLAPVISIGGVMGYAGIPLDMMTMMVVPMLLGLAVDDTIHFINHCKMEFLERGNYPEAIRHTFQVVGKSIFMTSFILIAAFSIYMTSIIRFCVNIGFLVFIGVSAALLSDYFVTPVLVNLTRPFGEKERDGAME